MEECLYEEQWMRIISMIFKDGLQIAVLQLEEGTFSELAFTGRNPGNSPNQSTILKYLQALWLPFLVFNNTENNEATKPTEDTELTITRFEALLTADLMI